ncbi:DUF4013 domain-containing protein [Candidatus Woesearchaeota archaeon]|nr:DUF4013 domain-containing protein [Candidatus Woesearchaeota archaeon]
MDYQQAIKRPFLDIKKLLIGIVLNIIPIVNFLSVGYLLETAKLTLNKKNNLPEWKDWWTLFVHGLLTFVIGAIYMIPAMVVGISAVGVGVIKGVLMNSVLEGVETGGPLLISALILVLVASYIVPMATLLYVKNWKFSSAFSFGEIFEKVLTGKYLVAWLISLVIGIVAIGILSIIPFLGSEIGSFIAGIISFTILAQAYNEIK